MKGFPLLWPSAVGPEGKGGKEGPEGKEGKEGPEGKEGKEGKPGEVSKAELTAGLVGKANLDGEDKYLDEAELPPSVVRDSVDNTFTGNQRFEGFLGMGGGGHQRMPVNLNTVQDGPTVVADSEGETEAIAFNYNAEFIGDFTGLLGPSPGWILGSSLFVQTGSAAGDGKGIQVIEGLNVGVALRAPDINIERTIGATFRNNFFGEVAGGKVGQMEVLRVAKPTRVGGAVAGEVTGTMYGLFVENAAASTIPHANVFSLYVEGGVSRFGGPVEFTNEIRNAGLEALTIYSNEGNLATGASLRLRPEGKGGGVLFTIPTVGAFLELNDGINTRFRVARTGAFEWGEGGSFDVNLFRNGEKTLKTNNSLQVGETFRHLGAKVGFYGHAEAIQPTGVAATPEAIIAALKTIGIFG